MLIHKFSLVFVLCEFVFIICWCHLIMYHKFFFYYITLYLSVKFTTHLIIHFVVYLIISIFLMFKYHYLPHGQTLKFMQRKGLNFFTFILGVATFQVRYAASPGVWQDTDWPCMHATPLLGSDVKLELRVLLLSYGTAFFFTLDISTLLYILVL